jgi:hypothetical protein
MKDINPCISDVVFLLTITPVAIWGYSLYLQQKIRHLALMGAGDPINVGAWYETISLAPGIVAVFLQQMITSIVACSPKLH